MNRRIKFTQIKSAAVFSGQYDTCYIHTQLKRHCKREAPYKIKHEWKPLYEEQINLTFSPSINNDQSNVNGLIFEKIKISK